MFKTIEQKSIENDAVYLDEIREGMILQGTVTAIERFGAFIDIGGIVGLLHISNMNWGYTEDPWEILNIGDKIYTKVISIDLNTSRFYLGLKQLTENPYTKFINQYPIGTKIKGIVTAFTHTRIIMQLSNGVKGGFIYSNLLEKYKNKIIQSINIGDEISSSIKGFNKGNHNISLEIDAEEFNKKISDKKLAMLLAFLAKNPINSI
ncbi:MAG TPA: 30S ribosomal protein S1, partial [Thiothrix sp.]|nr:30S ribosomal protein S1 [Thiothrix sp.]